jgi:hypothetical protein
VWLTSLERDVATIITTVQQQDKLFQELEREFMAGIGQGTSAKGLGFNW